MIQQVCFALGEEFFHLLGWDFSLEDDFAGAKVAGFFRADEFLAHIVHAAVIDGRSTLRAVSQRFLL